MGKLGVTRSRADSLFPAVSWPLVVLAFCLSGPHPAHAGANPDRKVANPTLAIVDGHAITQQDVDLTIANSLYQMRRSALERYIDDYLLAQAARRAHLSIPEYAARETAVTVTDADAQAQYDKYKGLMKVPFEQIKLRIVAALTSQRQAQRETALRSRLRKDAHIQIKLEQPRFNVAIGNSPSLGLADAPVTIIEFGDYESTLCKMQQATLQQIRDQYHDSVRLVFKDFPPLTSTEAAKAARAARCAGEQGKFWQFHDALCSDHPALAESDLELAARQVGLDSRNFDSCLASGRYSSAIEADIDEGMRLGVRSSPTFFVNGLEHAGVQSTAGFQSMIGPELYGKQSAKSSSFSR